MMTYTCAALCLSALCPTFRFQRGSCVAGFKCIKCKCVGNIAVGCSVIKMCSAVNYQLLLELCQVQFESLNFCFLTSFFLLSGVFSLSILSSNISPGSVRLVNRTSLCSGRLEVKTNQSTQRWSSVCEHDFDQQDAEVVCRELGCGAPSVLQGAFYGEVDPPMRTKEFQCGGHESALLDCRSSGSDRNTCSPGKAVGLTCSEPVRLVGGASRCAGTLQVKHQREWRPVGGYYDWPLKQTPEIAAAACRELDCGSAVSVKERESSVRSVWWIRSNCVQSGSALRECAASLYSAYILDLTCSYLLLQPNISVSSSMDGVSEAQQQGFQVFRGSTFNISCSIQPQYPGGSFQLTFTSSNSTHNSTQPAVNHSAHFLFPAAEPAHQGTYSCVYHLYVFSQNFSSESCLLSLTVSDPSSDPSDPSSVPSTRRPFIIGMGVFCLTLLLVITALYFYCKIV
uniref:SRCR domain-containing protein n=1 Tax=Sander lucioperca TaxID=283035 RepID=A0A8D0AJR6_SANLU